MQEIGSLICRLRKQQKMTQKVLAKGIVSESMMSRIENGSIDPDLLTLHLLLRRLGKSLEYFEIVVSNREYELLKKKEYQGNLNTTVVAEGEYFKDIREAKGLSQEQFSSDVCARETISNIENGRTPQRKKIRDLMEKQGESFEKYYGRVQSQEYELYEMAEQYLNMLPIDSEAKKLLEKMEERLDMECPVNRQFIESSKLIEDIWENRQKTDEIFLKLEDCLRYTMPEYDGTLHRIPFQQEVQILEAMVKCLKLTNKKDAAKHLWEEIAKKKEKKLKLS